MRSVALALLGLAVACASPTSWQTARLLAPGKVSVTAAGAYAVGENDKSYAAAEALVRVGATPDLEAGAQLSRLVDLDSDAGATLVYLDVKYALLPDELALQLPIGVAYRDDALHDPQVAPTLLGTLTFTRAISLDAALKLVIVADDADGLRLGKLSPALDVGLRFRSDRWPLELVPQVGIMFDDATHEQSDATYIVVGGGLAITWLP